MSYPAMRAASRGKGGGEGGGRRAAVGRPSGREGRGEQARPLAGILGRDWDVERKMGMGKTEEGGVG